MHYKSEAFEKFKRFRVQWKSGWIRVSGLFNLIEEEYLSIEFKGHLSENGILSQLTAPCTSQQNGVTEMRNMTFLAMVRFMMSFSGLHIFLWDMFWIL